MTNRARRIRQIIISAGICLVALAAFRLSFDAQTILAIASGADPQLGWIYPLTVDAAIVIVTLIAMWSDELARRLRVYLWTALGLWTAASVAGNALHILALPHGRVTLPEPIAIAVNTVPAVTLFLTIHIATTTVFRRTKPEPYKKPVQERRRPLGSVSMAQQLDDQTRADIPPVTIDQLMAMADDEGMSFSQIAERIGRSKSYVGQQVKAERERREAAA